MSLLFSCFLNTTIRLLVAGTLDEKMYQRQVRKQGLSGAVVDARDSERVHFSTEELKVRNNN